MTPPSGPASKVSLLPFLVQFVFFPCLAAGCVARAILSIEGVCGAAGQECAAHRDSCFELFGFDVLVDDALKPWVLEVNLSPSLSVESNLDFAVKTEM